MKTNGYQLMIADAHVCCRIGLRQILSSAGFVVAAEVEDIDVCKPLLARPVPSILFIACNLLPPNPLAFTANLHQQFPHTHIILFVTSADSISWQASVTGDDPADTYLHHLTNHGVIGAILKSDSPELIIVGSRTVAQGYPWISPPLLKQLLQTAIVPLTEEELTLLRLMVSGETEGKMAALLEKSYRTVRRRLRRVREKLRVNTRIEAAYVAGLRRLLPPE